MRRPTIAALAVLTAVVIALTVAPGPAAAEEQDLLMLLAQAAEEEPAVASPPTVASRHLPEKNESPENSPPPKDLLVRKVLRETQKLAGLGGLTLAALLLGILFLLGQAAFLGFTVLTGAMAPRHLDAVADLVSHRPWATFGLGLLNTLVGLVLIRVLLAPPPLRLFGVVALAWFLVRLLVGPASQARRVGMRILGSEHAAAPALGALVTGAAVLVPVAGQLALVVTAVQGLGAWIWLRLRRSPSNEAPEQPMTMA